ncbi:beta strand repeat-containing protein [Methylobacterium sp.]|uniref:beta strand repeat-containing protein n=1 Tax=Methylobacterium sp. TaxID=409 RepID=UPI003B02E5BB
MTLPNSTTDVTDLNKATGIVTTASRAGTLKAGDTVTFTLETETTVTVTGAPWLTLSNGATATYAGLDGEGRATFTYTIAAGEDDASLTVTGLELNGGSLDRPGQLGFVAAQNVAVGSDPMSVAVADVNEDGKLDILTANIGSSTVSVRLGDGAGGFSGATDVAVGFAPIGMTVADVNGDGKLDILTANMADNSVSVRLGDGVGGFSGTTEIAVGSEPMSVTVADVDGDGDLDILTANSGNRTVSVRLGDGDGGFSGTTEIAVGADPFSVTVADVNGDGKLDILTANGGNGTVSVRLGDGAGGFSGTTNVAVGSDPFSVTVADVDGDGDLDILTANNASGTVSVRLGDGVGGFSGTTDIAVGATPFSVTVADVSGDGHLDILTANGDSGTVSVRLGDGAGGFSGTTDITVGGQPRSATVADVNGDGRLDILTANTGGSNSASVLLNTSITALSFDPASVSSATTGADTDLAIDTTAPDLTGAQTVLADGTEDVAYTVTEAQLLEGWADAGTAMLTVSGLTSSSGTVTANPDGSFTITPVANATGPVTLTYGVSDGTNAPAPATRSFSLTAVNDAPSFSGVGTGAVLTPVGASTSGDFGKSVVIQADGKIVVAGYGVGSGGSLEFAVVRYNTDGSLDTTFGTGGKILTPVGTANGVGNSVTVQADGKIVVAGWGSGSGTGQDFAVVRYNTDGSLDTTFGTGGKIITPLGTGTSSDVGNSVTVQADGKIVVVGQGAGSGGTDFAVVRYNTDGSLDTTFGTGGKILTAVGTTTSNDYGNSVTVQADGKIVVAGTGAGSGTANDFAVVRYNADGTLDTGFGTDGKILTPVGTGTSSDIGYSVTVQSDGKIVVAGRGVGSGGTDIAVVRYNANGTLDTGFGTGGKILTPVGTGTSPDSGNSVTVQADGKIVVAGYGQGSDGQDFAVVRYNADGTLDTSFGPNGTGKILTPVGAGTSSDQGYGVTVQADGKIVVAGQAAGNGTSTDFAVVRYNADGSLDTTFNAPSSLGGTVAFIENGAAVILDSDVTLSDAELDALQSGAGDYAGATLTLARQGGADASDTFGFGASTFTVSGNDLLDTNGTTFATFTDTAGTLTITFTGTEVATSDLAEAVARRHLCQHLRGAGLFGHARLDVLGRQCRRPGHRRSRDRHRHHHRHDHGGERRTVAHRHPGDTPGRHGRHRLHGDGGPAA